MCVYMAVFHYVQAERAVEQVQNFKGSKKFCFCFSNSYKFEIIYL